MEKQPLAVETVYAQQGETMEELLARLMKIRAAERSAAEGENG